MSSPSIENKKKKKERIKKERKKKEEGGIGISKENLRKYTRNCTIICWAIVSEHSKHFLCKCPFPIIFKLVQCYITVTISLSNEVILFSLFFKLSFYINDLWMNRILIFLNYFVDLDSKRFKLNSNK